MKKTSKISKINEPKSYVSLPLTSTSTLKGNGQYRSKQLWFELNKPTNKTDTKLNKNIFSLPNHLLTHSRNMQPISNYGSLRKTKSEQKKGILTIYLSHRIIDQKTPYFRNVFLYEKEARP